MEVSEVSWEKYHYPGVVYKYSERGESRNCIEEEKNTFVIRHRPSISIFLYYTMVKDLFEFFERCWELVP